MKIMQTDSKKVKIICVALLAVMIAVQLGIITYYFSVKKQGYHMDELWSYGLSNSYYQPHLYARDDVKEWDEYNKWQDSDFFKNYLTVQENERFAYGSVYYNQENDVHPPLYYYILHTVCSFFPDTFSPYYAFSINAVSFVLAQVFLFLCAFKLTKSRFAAFCICALWGFSSGAITCFIYLRMYAMLVALTLIYTYFTLKILYDGFSAKRMAVLCVITYLGSLVQYFFIVYAGAMAACVCIYFLCKKKFKTLFAYGGFLLMSVALAVLSFTPMLKHMFMRSDYMGISATKSKHATFGLQLHFIIRYMLNDICGIDITLIRSPFWNYALCVLIVLAVICIPLAFLFRNETWFRNAVSKARTSIRSLFAFVKSKIGFSVIVLLIISVSIFSVFAVNGIVSPIAFMEEMSSHYSVQVYPLFVSVVIAFIYKLVKLLPNKASKAAKPLVFAVSAACILGSRLDCDVQYLFDDTEAVTIEQSMVDLTAGADCIVVVDGGSSIQYYPWDLYNANSLYFVKISQLDQYIQDYNKAAESERDVYLIVLEEAALNRLKSETVNDENSDSMTVVVAGSLSINFDSPTSEEEYASYSVAQFFEENTEFENAEFIGCQVVYTRPHAIYKLS